MEVTLKSSVCLAVLRVWPVFRYIRVDFPKPLMKTGRAVLLERFFEFLKVRVLSLLVMFVLAVFSRPSGKCFSMNCRRYSGLFAIMAVPLPRGLLVSTSDWKRGLSFSSDALETALAGMVPLSRSFASSAAKGSLFVSDTFPVSFHLDRGEVGVEVDPAPGVFHEVDP